MLKVAPLTPSLVPTAARVLTEAFGSDKVYNWGLALGRDPEAMGKWMRSEYVPGLVKDGVAIESLVAMDGDDVAGVLALEELKPSKIEDGMPEDMQCIMAILARGERAFFDGLPSKLGFPPTERTAYLAFLGTSPAFRKRGVADALVRASLDVAKKRGFRVAMALCTSPASTRIMSRAGFECWDQVEYASFSMPNGRVPFASLPDGMSVMVRRVSS